MTVMGRFAIIYTVVNESRERTMIDDRWWIHVKSPVWDGDGRKYVELSVGWKTR